MVGVYLKNNLSMKGKLKWKISFLLLACGGFLMLTLGFGCKSGARQHSFALGDSAFILDGKPFQIISGEIHYPRVPREAWRARLKMAKAMGLNTISTYVFWNLHEPEKGVFDFAGNNDIAEFVREAKEEGLWVILRPSPYVCAEWEFGGYPYWLQNEKGLIVRSTEAQYLNEYKKYIDAVGKELAPLQVNHGGNILMIQIENEYGSYGKDKEYLALNEKMFKDAGFDGLLYTCDPPKDLPNGYLPGLLPAVNGLVKPEAVKSLVRKYHNGKGPFLIAEWYPAWFDWWGTKHHRVAPESYATELDSVLASGLSINMYMFHGGTTRGFMNGANYKDSTPYEPQISSYDYDAPLDEAGNPTEKFKIFRSVIAKHLPEGETLPPVPASKPTMAINDIKLTKQTYLLDALPTPVIADTPVTFEKLHQAYGYVLYRTVVDGDKSSTLKIDELRDYAVVMVNGLPQGTMDRRLGQNSLNIHLPAGRDTLDIFVENLGRINFGPNLLKNNKGITHKVLLGGRELKGWSMYGFPFKTLDNFKWQTATTNNKGPVLLQGNFKLDNVADTYFDMTSWGKGVLWVNGHNLGRYWRVGPQQTVYVPKEWLKAGENTVTVLEELKDNKRIINAINHPILDSLQK